MLSANMSNSNSSEAIELLVHKHNKEITTHRTHNSKILCSGHWEYYILLKINLRSSFIGRASWWRRRASPRALKDIELLLLC
jgi:hypothetical protein